MTEKIICSTKEIPEGGSRGITIDRVNLLLVKKYGTCYLYHNRCPHTGVPLDWEEHQFLDHDGAYIRCANHGALFTLETGECVAGPCRGDALLALAFTERHGNIIIETDQLPALA